jgi:sugar lactone lactonase YvrE
MRKRATAAVLLALMSAVCGACISADDNPSADISVSPSRLNVAAGGSPVVLTATVGANAGRINWSLDGPGALAPHGDSAVTYSPPATVSASLTAVVTATLADSGKRASAEIHVDPPDAGVFAGDDSLRISPVSSTVYAGGPAVDFTAVVAGPSSLTWTLSGPGSLSFTTPLIARYLPPASVDVDTGAVLTAHLLGSSSAASTTILVRRPVGNLAVNVDVPAGSGLRPNITVSGPGGFTRTVSGSEVLAGLAVGSYSAVPSAELVTGSIVGTVYVPRITGSPASIPAGGTAAIDVVYSARVGSGHLWVADSDAPRLESYAGGQLAGSGTVRGDTELGLTPFSSPISGALGSNGDLWFARDAFTVVRFSPARQTSGAAPDVVLGMGRSGGFMDYVSGLAFDSSGNLWLASNPPPGLGTNRRILKFGASKLLASDTSPLPDVTLLSSSYWYPRPLAFDRAGNLWAADFSNDRLMKFAPSQLLADGAPAPATIISNVGPGNPLHHPIDIAIDGDGNLWVANLADESPADLVMYSATQAMAGGSPNPAIRIARPSLRFARGLAFDASGGLWMGVPGALARFSRTQLSSGGSPTPQTLVQDSALVRPTALVFSPPAEAIPLYR